MFVTSVLDGWECSAVQGGCFCFKLKHSQKTCVKTPQEECAARSAGTHFSSKTFSVKKGIPPINRFVSGNTKSF